MSGVSYDRDLVGHDELAAHPTVIELRVSESGEAVEKDLERARGNTILRYEVIVSAVGATRPIPVTVLAANIAAVADEQLPRRPFGS